MEGFLNWFFAFMTTMLEGIWMIIKNFFLGLVQIFNIPNYIKQFTIYKSDLNVLGWILAIFCFILTFAVWATLIFLLILLIRKYIRFRKTLVGNEDLLEEIADLHRDVIKFTAEKERIMAMKIAQTGLSPSDMANIFDNEDGSEESEDKSEVIDGYKTDQAFFLIYDRERDDTVVRDHIGNLFTRNRISCSPLSMSA